MSPEGKQLLPFLRELASDAEWSEDRVEFWIAKFFESIPEQRKNACFFRRPDFSAMKAEGFCAPRRQLCEELQRNETQTPRDIRI